MLTVANILLIPLVNILFFVVIQSTFFWLIGSKEALHVVESKAKMLVDTRKMLVRTNQHVSLQFLDTAMMEQAEGGLDSEELAFLKQQHAKQNWSLIKRWIGPWVVIGGILLVLCCIAMVYANKKKLANAPGFTLAHGVGLVLVIASYIGEICLFLFVIKRWVIFGDYEMLRLLTGCTPAARTYVPR